MSLVSCGISRLNCPSSVVETATISGGTAFNLNNGAWCVLNWDQALGLELRGEDILVPEVTGVDPQPRYITKTEPSINMVFDGNVDRTGASYAPNTVMHGLELNRRAFIDGAVRPPATTDNLFTLSLTLLDGTTISGSIHVNNFRFSYTGIPGLARAVWSISIPDGELT